MNHERGMTVIGMFFILVLVACAALVSFKVIPVYLDYFTVKHSLESILVAGPSQSNSELRNSMDKRLDVNFIQDIKGSDMQISRDGGKLTLTVPINRKEHLIGGVSISVDLDATASVKLPE
jgi:hypothetical protein